MLARGVAYPAQSPGQSIRGKRMKVYADRSTDTDKRRQRRGRRAVKAGRGNEEKVCGECERALEEYGCKGHAELGYKSSKDVLISTGNGNIVFNLECREGGKVDWRKAYRDAVLKMRGCSQPVAHCTDHGDLPVMVVGWKLGREMLAAMVRIEEAQEK